MDRSARWLRKRFSLKRHEDVERTDYFLPYIRRFLFPSLFEGRQSDGRPADDAPDTCRHYSFPLNLLDGRGTKWVDYRVHCRDSHKNVEQTFSVVLDRVELILFNYRVGFLVLRFRCTDPEATFFDQMRAANLLRFITPPHAEFQMPTLEGPAGRYKVPQLVAWLLDEFRRDGKPSANRPALQPDDGRVPARLIYDDRMLVYTFTCLDKETVLDDAQQNHVLLRRSVVVRFDDQTQATGRARTPDGTDTDWRRKRWESYSKDGGGLVVFDTDRYHRESIGGYWETYYFDIFLLAVLQRVTLLTLFERMADISRLTGGHGSRERLRHIRYDYLVFKNQCCFSQITNRERGLELWRKWQGVFETGTLLAEVNEQSDELDGFLRIRSREQNQKLLQLGGLVTTVAPVIWALDVILGDRSWIGPLRWGLLLSLFVTAGLTALYILRRGRREV
jgi:hypothetical protein